MFDIGEYYSRRLTGETVLLSVKRDNIWKDAFIFYKAPIDGTKPLRIEFEGDSEMGIDGGGPRREFFQLLANHLSSMSAGFFEGRQNMLLPVMKGPALRLRHFRIVGTIVAHSIINGGIGKYTQAHKYVTYIYIYIYVYIYILFYKQFQSGEHFLIINMPGLQIFKRIYKYIYIYIITISLYSLGFPCLASPMYEYMVTQSADSCLVYCQADMVTDVEARDIINEVSII